MKKLMMGIALTAIAASPALANSIHARAGYGPANDAYAYAPGLISSNRGPVFEYGKYQGNDPDPFIRQQLQRDPPNLDH